MWPILGESPRDEYGLEPAEGQVSLSRGSWSQPVIFLAIAMESDSEGYGVVHNEGWN